MANLFRADHIGSLLRPAELVTSHRAGAPADVLRTLEDREILRVISRQRALGLDVITDGELRRTHFMSDLTDAVDGFDTNDAVARSWSTLDDAGAAKVSSITGIVTGKLAQRRALTAAELPFLRSHAIAPLKITLPSATQFPAIAWKRGVSDPVYPTPSDLLWAIVEIIRAEMAALAGAGVPYLQIDAPRYSYYIDPKWRAWLTTELGVDPDAALAEAIRADNACFDAARRPGVTVAIHLCRGNNRGHWYAEGGYDAIAEQLFAELRVDRFLLEYDDARSGSFEPLRFVPRGKLVVLGLVSSKLAALEPVDALRRRIDDAARVVPLDELALSPQCGFASTMEGNLVTEADQWAKLARVVETARAVWGG
ncbi:MAG TPA: cobalamin-independent methionine synthase II family protein [Kofleriaceae bacterium]|jgi:5-methyltetrahydropteroyltriglutamate--homocysteine methyltransferase|nr:cobalamin-independent methionine synthase II family protein [Kofleriaceae bacterium]